MKVDTHELNHPERNITRTLCVLRVAGEMLDSSVALERGAVGLMFKNARELAKPNPGQWPVFTFPVVAWTPVPATHDPTDSGVRDFRSLEELSTNYLADEDLRLGWTFVDVNGRAWECVGSQVVGRAGPLWVRIWPRWLVFDARYRLAMDFLERPPLSFPEVRQRLLAAVAANRRFYGFEARHRRHELGEAQSLRDVVKSPEQRAVERLTPVSFWSQWLSAEGRCSRRAFAPSIAAIFVLSVLISASTIWVTAFPLFLLGLFAFAGLSVSLLIRRLHDLGRSGGWLALAGAFTLLCAFAHDVTAEPTIRTVFAPTWQISMLGGLTFLALAPGQKRHNRFGFARGLDAAKVEQREP